jgi:hypothetical protein
MNVLNKNNKRVGKVCDNYLQGGCECQNECKAQAESGWGMDLINQVLQCAAKRVGVGELAEITPISSRGGRRFLKGNYHEHGFNKVSKK